MNENSRGQIILITDAGMPLDTISAIRSMTMPAFSKVELT